MRQRLEFQTYHVTRLPSIQCRRASTWLTFVWPGLDRALANRLFVDNTPRHDPAVRLDVRVVRTKIVLANDPLEFANAGISEGTGDFFAGIGCVGLFDVEVMVVQLDVVDRLLLQIVESRRLAVGLVRVRETGLMKGDGAPLQRPRMGLRGLRSIQGRCR